MIKYKQEARINQTSGIILDATSVDDIAGAGAGAGAIPGNKEM